MFTTIITDCKGENEAGRQVTRYHALGLGPATLVGVSSGFGVDATIEAAGNLIDMLDASEGKKGTIVVNVAPRGVKTDGTNGNYFCYFWYKETLVISSTKGYCLSLAKKFDLLDDVQILETEKVLEFAKENNLIDGKLQTYIEKTQFRSFDFVPRVAKWLHDGVNLPSNFYSGDTIPDIQDCIWCIDAFGNCKTTILKWEMRNEKLDIEVGNEISRDQEISFPKSKTSHIPYLTSNLGSLPIYERLKDVPDGETAFYVGSSGIGEKRFIELATQNREGSAEKTLNLKLGQEILTKKK